MGVAFFRVNTLVQLDGVELRIYGKIGDSLWQLEEVRTRRIIEFEMADLLRKLTDGDLKFPVNGFAPKPDAANFILPEREEEIAKIRRLYVIRTLNVPNTRRAMEPVIRDTWKEFGKPDKAPNWLTLYRWKKTYIAAREDFRALIDNDHRKGNRKPRFPAEVYELTKAAISSTLMRRERGSIKATLDAARIRVREENEKRPQEFALPTPTRRFVTRLIKQIPAYEMCIAQRGREEARKLFRSVNGHRITEGPLQRAEMDHTVLDVIVIDEKHFVPLGRPYLTVILDDHTRCVLGIYLGFTPPSHLSVAQCLKHAILPKPDLRTQYPDIQSDWPTYGVMEELVVDNGREFHGKGLEQACLSLGIELHYSPRQTPWFKGKIERFFGTLNRGFAHTIPGTTFESIVKRGDYDSLSQACVTLADLQKYLRMWIVDDYHQTIHRSLGITPAQMWASSIRPEEVRLPDANVELDAIVGSVETRRLTNKGIQFSDLFYNSPALNDLLRKYGLGTKVNIRYDEADLGRIFVYSPESSTPIAVPALHQPYASGLSLWAHEICKKRADELPDDADRAEKLLKAKKALQMFVEQALKSKRKGLSKRVGRFMDGAGRVQWPTPPEPTAKTARADRQLPAPAIEPALPPAFSFAGTAFTAEETDEEVPVFKARLKDHFHDD